MKLLKWAIFVIISILMILLDALLMKWSMQYIPIFKEIGIALGLNNLSVAEYFIGILGYAIIYGIIKGILWFYKFITNGILGE